jgi:hypothetical protein
VNLYQFQKLHVAVGQAELDPRVWDRSIEAAILQEELLLLGEDQPPDVRSRRNLESSSQLSDFGVDELNPFLFGDGDTMVAVHNEKRIAHLVCHDGWKLTVRERALESHPAFSDLLASGEKVLVEVLGPAGGPEDLLYPNWPDAHVRLLEEPHSGLQLVKGQKLVLAIARYDSGNSSIDLPAPGALECRVDWELFVSHVSISNKR